MVKRPGSSPPEKTKSKPVFLVILVNLKIVSKKLSNKKNKVRITSNFFFHRIPEVFISALLGNGLRLADLGVEPLRKLLRQKLRGGKELGKVWKK